MKLVIEDDEGKRTVVPLTRDGIPTSARGEHHRSHGPEHLASARVPSQERPRRSGTVAHLRSGRPDELQRGFVNGIRVSHEEELAHGDLVQIGDYRVVIQDERLAEAADTASTEGKQTIPSAPSARAAALLDRPNRLVDDRGTGGRRRVSARSRAAHHRTRRRRGNLGESQLRLSAALRSGRARTARWDCEGAPSEFAANPRAYCA